MSLQPRPHQVAAIAAITRALAAHDRTQLVQACGTGKTLTGRWYAQASDCRLTVVFVPSLALVAQTLGEWRRAGDPHWPYEALVVCSDPSTAAGAAERAAQEGGTVDHGFWARVQSGVTTSPSLAAAALRRAGRPRGGRLVVFSTYHSAPVVAAACRDSGAVLDLMICDEAHRLAGCPRQAFRAVLDQRWPPPDSGPHLVSGATRLPAKRPGDPLGREHQHVISLDRRVTDGRRARQGAQPRRAPVVPPVRRRERLPPLVPEQAAVALVRQHSRPRGASGIPAAAEAASVHLVIRGTGFRYLVAADLGRDDSGQLVEWR